MTASLATIDGSVLPATSMPVKIEVSGVEKRFADDGKPATLAPLDLAIRENEFVSIVGRSGCGKTTLLNILAGLIAPTRGEVRVDGQRVEGPGRGKGVVFQQHALFPWLTARANIAFGAKSRGLDTAAAGREADQLLELIGLMSFGDLYPSQLSGGQQQRVAIARALALDPHILLMDEPFGALDEITRLEMQEELLRVWSSRRKTVVFVTHGLSEALYLSDRVLVMAPSPGRIAAEYVVDLPRPRSRVDRRMIELQDAVWEHLK
ncbi:ABC transporter ATP-binding protein [Vineibacter terrae]|uniref:ABC transporter ATP-binding protein n=1 Tax=Vineibacter terrae TaxID=2586908 RepID=UPI002E358381|nr:ABC transporter ATP-binding protein [Vineibacter terrae]HEX2885203.1 ABC transporter ATP-binding protein [Vineibacter terrae]